MVLTMEDGKLTSIDDALTNSIEEATEAARAKLQEALEKAIRDASQRAAEGARLTIVKRMDGSFEVVDRMITTPIGVAAGDAKKGDVVTVHLDAAGVAAAPQEFRHELTRSALEYRFHPVPPIHGDGFVAPGDPCTACGGSGVVPVRRNSRGENDYLDGAVTGEEAECQYCGGSGEEPL